MIYALLHVCSIIIPGDDAVTVLSERVSQINVQTRFIVDDDTWPPEQLKGFTPLSFVHYQGLRNSNQAAIMANIMHAGRITSLVTEFQSCITHHTSTETLQNSLGVTRVTNKLEEILTPLENSNDNSSIILIEGPPGIGKSVLLKEIAYRWGEGYLLQKFKMVLLVCLRESNFQQAKTIPDLLRYFCKGDPDATELSNACSKYFLKNGGKDLVFLFDGFDELPEKLQKDGLIAYTETSCPPLLWFSSIISPTCHQTAASTCNT